MGEAFFVRHIFQGAITSKSPGMVRAGKGKTMSLALPNKLHAAMKAYVMEGAKLTRAFAANQDRRRQASYFPYNPISRLRTFLLPVDIQPDPTEDRPLPFEPLLGGIVGPRTQIGRASWRARVCLCV